MVVPPNHPFFCFPLYTIHFGVPLFSETPISRQLINKKPLTHLRHFGARIPGSITFHYLFFWGGTPNCSGMCKNPSDSMKIVKKFSSFWGAELMPNFGWEWFWGIFFFEASLKIFGEIFGESFWGNIFVFLFGGFWCLEFHPPKKMRLGGHQSAVFYWFMKLKYHKLSQVFIII